MGTGQVHLLLFSTLICAQPCPLGPCSSLGEWDSCRPGAMPLSPSRHASVSPGTPELFPCSGPVASRISGPSRLHSACTGLACLVLHGAMGGKVRVSSAPHPSLPAAEGSTHPSGATRAEIQGAVARGQGGVAPGQCP